MKKSPKPSFVLPLIRLVRGQRVILDSDLAGLYDVSTSQLNQQVRRNGRRFPDDFAFQLTHKENILMLSQFVTASRKRNLRKPPIAFTEHGVVMAANVLRSESAVIMSVEIVRAFIQFRRFSSSHEKIAKMLVDLEEAVSRRLDVHDREIKSLFDMMTALIGSDPRKDDTDPRVGRA